MSNYRQNHEGKPTIVFFMQADDPIAVRELYNLVSTGMEPELVSVGWPPAGQYVIKIRPGTAVPKGDKR